MRRVVLWWVQTFIFEGIRLQMSGCWMCVCAFVCVCRFSIIFGSHSDDNIDQIRQIHQSAHQVLRLFNEPRSIWGPPGAAMSAWRFPSAHGSRPAGNAIANALRLDNLNENSKSKFARASIPPRKGLHLRGGGTESGSGRCGRCFERHIICWFVACGDQSIYTRIGCKWNIRQRFGGYGCLRDSHLQTIEIYIYIRPNSAMDPSKVVWSWGWRYASQRTYISNEPRSVAVGVWVVKVQTSYMRHIFLLNDFRIN